MGNGAQVRSEGTVQVAVSIEDAEGRRTPAHDIEFETLPGGPTTPILLGSHHPLLHTPDTPLNAIHPLTTAQPYIGTVADLESQEPPLVDTNIIDLGQADHSIEDNEIDDQVALWTLPTDEQAWPSKRVWFEQPIEQDRLKTLQHLLPVEVNDPEYQAACQQNHIKFDPYQVSGKPDDLSEEYAERVTQALKVQFSAQGMPEEHQHLRALLKAKHLTFAKTASDCKQNHVVICDPQLIEEPPNTAWCSKMQAQSPLQKEFLHWQVCKLMDNGFLVKIPGDQVWWISETHIVQKPAAEIESNVSIEELQCQVNTSLKAAGLEHNPTMPDPTPLPTQLSEAQTTKAQCHRVCAEDPK
ncbi:uncharacterized protein UBRO_20979 [Ustilago bromivora]|uniref:Uncharacterized protein n=1 Tax=Ustilago bromivora TaxID=307758 RepID=A0A1K0HDD3_9BASI|nr:uncharacterized protein UBRO_20979 [Ustilago bromivora]